MSFEVELIEEARNEVAIIATAALPVDAAEELCSLMEASDHMAADVILRDFEGFSNKACSVYQLPASVGGEGWGPEFAENFRSLITVDDIAADAFTEDRARYKAWSEGFCARDGVAENAPFFLSQGFWNEVGALTMAMRERDAEIVVQIVALNAPKLLPDMRQSFGSTGGSNVTSLAGGMRSLKRFWQQHGERGQIGTMSDDTLVKYTMRLLLEMSDANKPELIFSSIDEVHSSFDFEIWCAEQLTTMGCPAHLRPQGGPAGIDVIAKVGRKKVGVRCQFHGTGSAERLIQEVSQAVETYELDQTAIMFVHAIPNEIAVRAREAGIITIKASEISQITAYEEIGEDRQEAPYLI